MGPEWQICHRYSFIAHLAPPRRAPPLVRDSNRAPNWLQTGSRASSWAENGPRLAPKTRGAVNGAAGWREAPRALGASAGGRERASLAPVGRGGQSLELGGKLGGRDIDLNEQLSVGRRGGLGPKWGPFGAALADDGFVGRWQMGEGRWRRRLFAKGSQQSEPKSICRRQWVAASGAQWCARPTWC